MDPYLGEIRLVALNYAPKGWALCSGQLLAINSNSALYALLGTQFGGNGTSNFALPNLNSRVPVGTGPLAGGSNYVQSQMGGVESVTLTTNQMPPHVHPVTGTLQTAELGDPSSPQGNFLAADANKQFSAGPATAQMGSAAQGTTGNNGSGQAHENRQPVLGINYIIALQGIFPTRP